jgi:hypothetical protein
MNLAASPRSLKIAFAVFLALTAVPFLMNAFPRVFAGAFSEHVGEWSGLGLLLMAVALTAWAWAALQLGREWRCWQTAGFRPIVLAAEIGKEIPLRWRTVGRWALIFHGPILVGLFYLMWISARIALGRWPRWGGADDPKSIAGASIVYWTICIWFWVGVLALAAPLFRAGASCRAPDRAGSAGRDFMMTATLLAVSLITILSDPHHLLTWLMD